MKSCPHLSKRLRQIYCEVVFAPKDTKGSDNQNTELRALRDLRGEKLSPIGLRLCRVGIFVVNEIKMKAYTPHAET